LVAGDDLSTGPKSLIDPWSSQTALVHRGCINSRLCEAAPSRWRVSDEALDAQLLPAHENAIPAKSHCPQADFKGQSGRNRQS